MTTQLELTSLQNEWCDRMATVVLNAMKGREFTADDLHSIVEPPAHDNWFGVLMAKLRCTGKIESVGAKASERPERNGGLVRVWRVRE